MKKISFLLFSVVCAVSSIAQTCTLSGTVKDTTIKELELELLNAGAQNDIPVIKWQVANGDFKQKITLSYPLFAILKAGNKKQKLLLSPNRRLHLLIDTTSIRPIPSLGAAAEENELVQNSVLALTPFFMKEKDNPYRQITIDGWRDSLMRRVEKDIAANTTNIRKAAIPARLQKILISEIKYAYQCYLTEFTVNTLRFAKNPNHDSLTKLAIQWQPMPDSVTLQSGYYANMVLDRHSRYGLYTYLHNKARDKSEQENRIADYLGLPFATLDSLVKTYGESTVITWLYATRRLPAGIQDKMLFNNIMQSAGLGSILSCRFMLEKMQQHFPHSHYLPAATATVQQIADAVHRNENNARIHYNNAAGITSLNDLIKPYAGKVVYLDLWGTWCGPCKMEMPFTHALKQRFAGKDLVFIYLADDEDSKETEWRKFIQFAGLEGQHYRMNRKAMKAIWDDLRQAGCTRLQTYPTYVIFDRQGTIVHVDAERPSSKEKLYAQLDKIL